jgi:ribosomal protein L30E
MKTLKSDKKINNKKVKKLVVKSVCPECKSKNIFYYGDVGSCKDCYFEWYK